MIDTNKARELAKTVRKIGKDEGFYDLLDAAALLLAFAAERDRDAKDAARFRWLTTDHDDPETRRKCRELLERMAVISYFAASRDIDAAMGESNG